MASRYDLEVCVWDELSGATTDLGLAIGILVAPDHQHGRRDRLQFGIRQEVRRSRSSEPHREPHVAEHRGSIAGLTHAFMDHLKETLGRSLSTPATDSTASDRRVTATLGEPIRATR